MKAHVLFVVAAMFIAISANSQESASRHNAGGSLGPNGVKQRVAIKINKTKTGTDAASIQIDLGEHKYDSTKSAALQDRPQILITIGSLPTMTGLANEKGKIESESFKAKLINNGAGMKIDLRKADLSALLSDISGKGEHVFLTITVQDNHAPAPAAAQSRHANSLYTKEFELDVQESEKALKANG